MAATENSRISPAKLALAVKRLRADKASLELIASDPIAIIGMGCRFPGNASSPESYWELLRQGRDGVVEIPKGRWKDSETLKPHMRRGGYLPEIDRFDAAYFGIAPREAQQIDPQQRLLLEVAWEALWDAGIVPASLTGTDAGVFVAVYNNDYARMHSKDAALLTAYSGVGTAHSVAAGRLSFLLDIKGPSLAVDSACSSSLVAVHVACQSLRAGECGMAIVGASSLKALSYEVQVFLKWGMLSSDGRCKTFDAAADGFAPGEGSGVVILKRLSDALQDGDRIRAVIRGTATNHDGRTTVLSAPNSLAQEAVLRAALRNAKLQAQEVDYIETHGTGTSLGDPIEFEAIHAVYGSPRTDEGELGKTACVLGAVKTNLGHLEAAAGMAGLIKTVLCLEHGEIPRNLHFHRLNPEISLEGTRLMIPTANVPWARSARPRLAGVSSFGVGGTNGHVLVEEAPLLPARGAGQDGRTIPLAAYAWRRQRCWLPETRTPAVSSVEPSSAAGSAAGSVHPLLGRPLDSAFVEGKLFASELNAAATPYLRDHSLGERMLVPFAAFLEITAAAIRQSDGSGSAASVRDFVIREPLFLSSDGCRLQVLAGEDSVAIASANAAGGWTTNARSSFERLETEAEPGVIDLAGLRGRCREERSPEALYETLERTGLRYGSAFRTIQSLWAGDGESLAFLRLSGELREEGGAYGLHPALLDGCLQAVAVARADSTDDLFLPIHVDRFELHRLGLSEVWVHTKITAVSGETFSSDLAILDATGGVVARLTGFTVKRAGARLAESLARQSGARAAAPAYEIAWRTSPLGSVASLSRTSSASRAGERWLLLGGREEALSGVARTLAEQGAVCEMVHEAASCGAALARGAWTGVVYDARSIEGTAADGAWQHLEKDSIDFALEFVRSLGASRGRPAPRLWVVTSSAVAVLPFEDAAIAQAPLWGMVRSLSLEHPETAPVLIDVGSNGARAEEERMLGEEFLADGPDSIVALRCGTRYVARLVPYAGLPETVAGLPETAQRLRIEVPGRLEDLHLEETARMAPAPDEVEIRVRASGLNFRDVLTALGMFPVLDPKLGGECAGTIVRVGSAVEGWKAGDDVLAFAPASLQSLVTVAAEFVARKPAAMTFPEAAGVPVAFLTALYGLDRLAGLAAGQTILIHAGAGGLGLAAIQLALRAGGEVFATAGSVEKREFLKKLGVKRVFDSRSLGFRDEVLRATEGRGVDVVLNSLAGDFIRASLEVVAQGGCFLEVGKRDLWTADEVAALGREIRYFVFDLGEVANRDRGLLAAMLRELMERFATGELEPLRTTLYAFEDSTHAFRTMAQARHIGKIVLGMKGGSGGASVGELVADGTVLITGGLGALGTELARWLATQGTRKIVLAGRSAHEAAESAIVAELLAQGVEVRVERVDVAAPDELARVLDTIRRSGRPLRAVFHAAGIVQDATLTKESWSRYREATAPKIDGAWNLHRMTEDDPVRLMVFFSSAASILGSPGQGSYTAGNAFLDALAHSRASRGLATLSVNWGAWASGGMAARLTPELAARWARQGAKPMEAEAAFAAMRMAIESGRPQVAIMDMNWEQFLRERPAMRGEGLFAELQRGKERTGGKARREAGILEVLRAAPAGDQKSLLSMHVKACACRVMGLPESSPIQDGVALQDIGLDSLMALEMRNELAQSLGLTLGAGLLFDYPAVEGLTQHLLGMLAPAKTAGAEAKGAEANGIGAAASSGGVAGAEVSVAALNSLSEEEAELLLLEELDRVGREKINV
jgi:acyl transferase domain-containing protein/NADPH:quinone reductase-like Zn-dependent oxidoreductase